MGGEGVGKSIENVCWVADVDGKRRSVGGEDEVESVLAKAVSGEVAVCKERRRSSSSYLSCKH